MYRRLNKIGNAYSINGYRAFNSIFALDIKDVKEAFNFAYNMTFGETGEHRNHRTGGTHQRRKGEIFNNTFQGKLVEFGLYRYFTSAGISSTLPDTATYALGKWDDVDLSINGKKINVKSTKHYGHLLLLETKDWDTEARYLPNITSNNAEYDIFILCRVSPDNEKLMKEKRFLYSDCLKSEDLEFLMAEEWKFDIAGFILRDELIQIIKTGNILPQGALLNGRIVMDASNYYVQAGDMHEIPEIFKYL